MHHFRDKTENFHLKRVMRGLPTMVLEKYFSFTLTDKKMYLPYQI